MESLSRALISCEIYICLLDCSVLRRQNVIELSSIVETIHFISSCLFLKVVFVQIHVTFRLKVGKVR